MSSNFLLAADPTSHKDTSAEPSSACKATDGTENFPQPSTSNVPDSATDESGNQIQCLRNSGNFFLLYTERYLVLVANQLLYWSHILLRSHGHS